MSGANSYSGWGQRQWGGQEDLRCLESCLTQDEVKSRERPGGPKMSGDNSCSGWGEGQGSLGGPQMPGDTTYSGWGQGQGETKRILDV